MASRQLKSVLNYWPLVVFCVYLEIGKQSMRQPIHFGKIFSSSTTSISTKTFEIEIYSRQLQFETLYFIFQNVQTAIVCYKFSISNVFVEIEVVELEQIFPKMYRLSH